MGIMILVPMNMYRKCFVLLMLIGLISCSDRRDKVVAYVDNEPLKEEEIIFYALRIKHIDADSFSILTEKEMVLPVARGKILQIKLRDEGILYEDNLDADFSKKTLQDLSFDGYKRRYESVRNKIKYKYGPDNMDLSDKYADHLYRIKVALKQEKIKQCISKDTSITADEASWAFEIDTLNCWFDKMKIEYVDK